MTDEELKDLVASLAVAQKETDRQIRELKQQIGGLGNKFGGFAEGMAFPSMKKVLWETFKMEHVSTRVRTRQGADEIELDVLAYANTTVNEVYIVEVKSALDDRAINQILSTLKRFPKFFPEHNDKALYGILAIVDSHPHTIQRALEEGLYLAEIHDDLFEITSPKGFVPKSFSPLPV